jgi:hypothetical protein
MMLFSGMCIMLCGLYSRSSLFRRSFYYAALFQRGRESDSVRFQPGAKCRAPTRARNKHTPTGHWHGELDGIRCAFYRISVPGRFSTTCMYFTLVSRNSQNPLRAHDMLRVQRMTISCTPVPVGQYSFASQIRLLVLELKSD